MPDVYSKESLNGYAGDLFNVLQMWGLKRPEARYIALTLLQRLRDETVAYKPSENMAETKQMMDLANENARGTKQ